MPLLVEPGILLSMKTVLVTGGAGFIGSHFTRYLLAMYPDYLVRVLDALTYSGNRANLADLESDPRFTFIHGDVRDKQAVGKAMKEVQYVVHFAAETHVDRSIIDPETFITTDVYGTYVMLETAKAIGVERFVHISTDEVYGSIAEGTFKETDPLMPNSPYSASKAGADLLARSYYQTYRLPVLITRGSNTFGPNQYPEKMIPLFVTNALEDKPLPIYGDGLQVRDWLFVMDHVSAIAGILQKGTPGEVYNIGGDNERTNKEVTELILKSLGKSESLINFVQDRPGHDRRYALDISKLRALGWEPVADFETALGETVQWYVQNRDWWEQIKRHQEEYKRFSQRWYAGSRV
jgi:dTDP-glucose 4,6-dehydratase